MYILSVLLLKKLAQVLSHRHVLNKYLLKEQMNIIHDPLIAKPNKYVFLKDLYIYLCVRECVWVGRGAGRERECLSRFLTERGA